MSKPNHQKPSYIFISCSHLGEKPNLTKLNPAKPEYLRAEASVNDLGGHMCYLKCAIRFCPSPNLLGTLFGLKSPNC